MPYSRSHACLPCDLLCAHIAALRSKKSVSIPPCGKCSVNLSRLRYRLLTAWHFCFPGLFTNAKCGCWQYMPRKIPDTKENVRPFDSGFIIYFPKINKEHLSIDRCSQTLLTLCFLFYILKLHGIYKTLLLLIELCLRNNTVVQ